MVKRRAGVGVFSGETRAQDGCIVTFELDDGSIHVERFRELVFSSRKEHQDRKATRVGRPHIEQAATRADELGAKIVSICTPQTILTDLQGTRELLEKRHTQAVLFPEINLLGKIKRLDLFSRPSGGQAGHNVRQVRRRRPSRAGRQDQ